MASNSMNWGNVFKKNGSISHIYDLSMIWNCGGSPASAGQYFHASTIDYFLRTKPASSYDSISPTNSPNFESFI